MDCSVQCTRCDMGGWIDCATEVLVRFESEYLSATLSASLREILINKVKGNKSSPFIIHSTISIAIFGSSTLDKLVSINMIFHSLVEFLSCIWYYNPTANRRIPHDRNAPRAARRVPIQ